MRFDQAITRAKLVALRQQRQVFVLHEPQRYETDLDGYHFACRAGAQLFRRGAVCAQIEPSGLAAVYNDPAAIAERAA